MFSFYFFGQNIEFEFKHIFDGFGGTYFIVLYLMAIVVSDLPSYFKHRHNPGYNSLGASGGVAAIIFASIILNPLNDIYIYFVRAPGFIVGTLYLVFSFYMGRKSNDGINHDAHLYGALFGLLFCAVLYPASLPQFIEQILSWRF
jgi:membrane associated rhomboid family serine protease